MDRDVENNTNNRVAIMKKFIVVLFIVFGLITSNQSTRAWGPLPSIVGGGRGIVSLYDAWDETDEAGWGDSANTVIGFMEALNAGDDETVQGGGLAGADLVWTETGTLPGATGSPPTRQFNTGYLMDMTQACAEITKGSTWCIIVKLIDLNDVEGSFVRLSKGDNDTIILLHHLNRTIKANFLANAGDATYSAAPATGTVYVAMQANGVDDVTYGWSTDKIVRWSGIPDSQKGTIAGIKGDASAQTYIATQQYIMTYYAGSNAAYQVTAKVRYIIISKSVIILP